MTKRMMFDWKGTAGQLQMLVDPAGYGLRQKREWIWFWIKCGIIWIAAILVGIAMTYTYAPNAM